MIQIDELDNQKVKIIDFKTTYIVLEYNNELYRFYFNEKKEAFLKQKEEGFLNVFIYHPLLINHNESYQETFINSSPNDVDLFIQEIQECIDISTNNCWNWTDYLEINEQIFKQNILDGSGKLLRAPFSIIENIEQICNKHNVKLKIFGEKTLKKNKLIILNNQFVIAHDFNLFQKKI